MFTFQKVVSLLFKFWSNLGSSIIQPFDIEIGAATFHPITFFNSINKNNIFFCYLQLCRRPSDSKYGKIFNKFQQYYQFQVIKKPFNNNLQNIYIDSLKFLGIDLRINDISFIDDNWENPTLGAYGIGWEVWLNGIEITQFTYFKQMAGFECIPSVVEITYGLERILMHLQNVYNIKDLIWDNNIFGVIKYNDVVFFNEIEKSFYNLCYSDTKFLINSIINYENQCLKLISFKKPLIISSYEFAIKIVNYFNLLDAREYFSYLERQSFILRIRNLFNNIAKIYLKY